MAAVDHEKELGVPGHLACGVVWYAIFIAIALLMYVILVPIAKSLMHML